MQKKTNSYHDFVKEEYTSFKKGLDFQREIFKNAMHEKSYDSAVTALQSIKLEINKKARIKGSKRKLLRVELICRWYRNLPLQYTQKYEFGYGVMYPANIEQRIVHNLNIAYELLTDQLNVLGLI